MRTIGQAAALVRAGEVSATEVLEAAIARVEKRNPAINAVVMELYDFAAQAIEAGLPDGPLTGVPFLLKDLGSSLAGARTARGSRFFADLPPASEDSLHVTRLKQAGMTTAVVDTGGDPGHAPAPRTYESAGFRLFPIARYFKKL